MLVKYDIYGHFISHTCVASNTFANAFIVYI